MSRLENNDRLKETYINWLGEQLREKADDNGKSYEELLHILFEKEFVVIVHMDENRVEDGLALRGEFRHTHQYRPVPTQRQLDRLGPCSFLEVLIGLSRRLAFNAGGSSPTWAWQLLGNLDLQVMSDPLTLSRANETERILDTVIRRTYAPDGTGGFFPLAWADDDQTRIELWYQMHAYIGELHPEN